MTSGAQRSWSGVGPVEAFAGDMITVNPGEIHDGVPIGGARGLRMLYFAPATLFREADASRSLEIARPAFQDPVLAASFDYLFFELTAERPDELAVDEAMTRTLARITRNYVSGTSVRPTKAPSVRRALRRLDEAPAQNVSLAELAALSGVSRFQLLRGFARDVGATPHAYVTQKRVRWARRLLAAGVTPAQAAAETGFADQSHLTRAFSRQFGTTPARYQAALR